MCLEINMLKNKKSLLIVITPMIIVLLYLFGVRQMEPLNMNEFPAYYTYWILHSFPLMIISFILLICFSGKGSLKNVLLRETREILQKYDLTKDWITVQA
jgi:hypothetical protein